MPRIILSMSRRYYTHIAPSIQAQARPCDHDGCVERAHYPAPRQRHALQDYYWFCLAHIREYNKRWDYFAGMNEGQIEGSRQLDTVWERPSWPVSQTLSRVWPYMHSLQGNEKDPYTSLTRLYASQESAQDLSVRWFATGSAEEQALTILGLEQPLALELLKKTYKELAKKFHPDRHKGCKSAENKLRSIIASYNLLKKAFQH